MNKILLLIGAAGLAWQPAFFALSAAESSSSTESPETSGGIVPGMSEAEVTELLGAPKSRSQTPWGDIIIAWEVDDPAHLQDKSRTISYVFDAGGKVLRQVPDPNH